MPKEAVSTTKLEPESGAEFMTEAPAAHRPASQVMRELMRKFVQRQREAREYEGFLRHKVDCQKLYPCRSEAVEEEVEAEFSAWRANAANHA